MSEVLYRVPCPSCGSDAEIRQITGKCCRLDLKCSHCGVLNYQTAQGQVLLAGKIPGKGLSRIPGNIPGYTGKMSPSKTSKTDEKQEPENIPVKTEKKASKWVPF